MRENQNSSGGDKRTRQPGPRLALLVLLKAFQRLGYAVRLAYIHPALVTHVAASAGLAGAASEMAGYDDTSYRIRVMALVRGFIGVAGYDRAAPGMAARACVEAARTRDDLTDIVNAGIEELLRCRRELPAFGTLLKLARSARALFNRAYHRRIASSLQPQACERLAALLLVPDGATRSGWDQVKADPPRPSPQRMREHLVHLAWLRGQAVADDVFAGIPDRKLRHFAAEARALNAVVLSHVTASKRGVLAFPGPCRPSLHLAGLRHRAGSRFPPGTPDGPPEPGSDLYRCFRAGARHNLDPWHQGDAEGVFGPPSAADRSLIELGRCEPG